MRTELEHHFRNRTRWRFLRSREFWSGAGLVVVIGLLSYFFENVKDEFPWLLNVQLWSYGHLVPEPKPEFVVGVEIDNKTFFEEMQRSGPEDITNRKYLAEIVRNAVDAKAAVIALDINLVRQETNSEAAPEDNDALWDAIQYATKGPKPVPVVLTFAFDTRSMRPLANVFDVPICHDPANAKEPRAGFDHAPEDRRKAPLVVGALSSDGTEELTCRSFALQIADSYQASSGMTETAVKHFDEQIEHREFAYISFIPQAAFTKFPAYEVHDKIPNVLAALNGRIVLIGGNRTGWRGDDPDPSAGKLIDYHHSPKGMMAGMYFHANYVEGLLGGRFLRPVPRGLGAFVDMLLATAIILSIHRLRGWQRLRVVVMLVAIPVAMAYGLARLGWCFDWVIPVFLSFLHPALDQYLDIGSDPLRRHAHE